MLEWLVAHDGSVVNAASVDSFTFDVIESDGKQIMFVVAVCSGFKILMQPIQSQAEGINFIKSIAIHVKKKYEEAHGSMIKEASEADLKKLVLK